MRLCAKRYAAGVLLATLAGCAGVPGDGDQDHESAEILAPQGEGEADTVSTTLAEVALPDAKLVFIDEGSDVGVIEIYDLGTEPFLTEEDRELDALELYRRYAGTSEVPAAMLAAVERHAAELSSSSEGRVDSDRLEHAGEELAGNEAAEASSLGRSTQALELGEGCAPTQSNVVFADCRQGWWNGYFAEGAPTFRMDLRVQALVGGNRVTYTTRHRGNTTSSTVDLAQGKVARVAAKPKRACKYVAGIKVDCWDEKSTRRVDITNAIGSSFNVDVVFYN
jgi:hypothetical protein